MKISSDEIRQEAKLMWPDLEYIWLMDKNFWAPHPDVVAEALRTSNVPKMQFIPEFNDCDDFTIQWIAEVRRKRYIQWERGNLPDERRWPITSSFGFGDQFRGISKNHVASPVFTEDGFYMVDATPGENRMWKIKRDQDNIVFLFA